jgi:predicted dehydrogenase
MDRRQFLHSTAAAGLALSGAVPSFADEGKVPRVGVIGCGWFGMYDLQRLMDVAKVEVVSLCDVDKKMLEKAFKEVTDRGQKKPKTFGDYRKMLEPKELDIVIVGTPDHWHALNMIAAVESGADVYVEKPISVSLLEGRAMVAAARKNKRVVQVGTQRRSTDHFKKAYDFVREGKLGKIALVHAYCFYHMRGTDNPPDTDPPEGFDFEMWTGPAPMRKYNPMLHPKTWRKFNEYGNGILGDMGVHMLDAARWIMDLKYPKRVFSTGGIFVQKTGKSNITDTQTVTYDYGDLEFVWEHRTWGCYEHEKYPWGISFHGDKGTLQINLDLWEFTPPFAKEPAKRVECVKSEDKVDANIIPANRAHMKDFLTAIGTRGKPIADIEEGHISTAICILGNISQQLGRSLTWDGEKEQVVGDEEANKLLKRKYREPWVFPSV